MLLLELDKREKYKFLQRIIRLNVEQMYYNHEDLRIFTVNAADILIDNKFIHHNPDVLERLINGTISTDVLGRVYVDDVLLEIRDLFNNKGFIKIPKRSSLDIIRTDNNERHMSRSREGVYNDLIDNYYFLYNYIPTTKLITYTNEDVLCVFELNNDRTD